MEERFGINRFALIRSFRHKCNTTPNAYQLQLRVNYGRQLLKGNGDIADIAVTAGFIDIIYT
ncbi:MAG TPA: helix-turn-helix domain-containing protein, partial [Negativicutes bacterium]|nr:helix-turn-helix domain-containing protein [Negativicutes bacterium]